MNFESNLQNTTLHDNKRMSSTISILLLRSSFPTEDLSIIVLVKIIRVFYLKRKTLLLFFEHFLTSFGWFLSVRFLGNGWMDFPWKFQILILIMWNRFLLNGLIWWRSFRLREMGDFLYFRGSRCPRFFSKTTSLKIECLWICMHQLSFFYLERLLRYTSLKFSYSEACDFPTFFHTYLFTRYSFVKT